MVAKQTQSSKMKRRFAWPLAIAMGLTTTVATANDEEGGDPPPPPPADLPSSGLSESETSYTGAVMLRGNHEVTMESVVPGYVGDESYQADGRYAYFSGNTLYAGVQDDEGNYVDMIAEFFWFESSIDRGSDFYVAVVKARTSPNLKKWVLRRESNEFMGYFLPDEEATLYLRAQTDVSGGDSAFRWDWSVPFDNYGWDTFGNVTMETKYGLSVDAEGSSQKAFEFEKGGVPVEAKVQAKGYFNSNYQVNTKYEVTLHRWEVVVHGSAGQMDWQMNLHSKDREKQNAYHEYFIAMQADQGVPFKLDWLEVGGSVKDPKWYWFDETRSLSSAVTGLTLRPPQLPPPPPADDGTDNTDGTDGNDEPPAQDPPAAPAAPEDSEDPSDSYNYYSPAQGCSVGSIGSAPADKGWMLGLLGLGLVATRRRKQA